MNITTKQIVARGILILIASAILFGFPYLMYGWIGPAAVLGAATVILAAYWAFENA
jgi:hypothetical protein